MLNYFMGATFMMFGMILGQYIGYWLDETSCAQKHNVYSCDRTVSWVPITSLK